MSQRQVASTGSKANKRRRKWKQKTNTKNEHHGGGNVVVRLERVERWSGLSEAARLTGRTPTQIKRHVTGEHPSRKLAEDMRKLGIIVETAATVEKKGGHHEADGQSRAT